MATVAKSKNWNENPGCKFPKCFNKQLEPAKQFISESTNWDSQELEVQNERI